MEKLKLLLIALLFCLKTSAQTEFMPIGSVTNFIYSGYKSEGSGVFKPLKDTLYNGEPYRKIEIIRKSKIDNGVYSEIIFLQQKGDSIFEYKAYLKKKFFLFKNQYNVGDSMDIKESIVNFTFTVATVFVDSVVVENGVKRYACRLKCLPHRSADTLFFVPFNMYDKFIPDYGWQLYDICSLAYYDIDYFYPLCYTENAINYHTPLYTGPNCDSITKPIEVLKSNDFTLTLFPNPANAYLTIKSNQKQLVRLTIFNINGQLVLEKTITTTAQLNISPLPDGVYIVKAESDKGISLTQKLIIHH